MFYRVTALLLLFTFIASGTDVESSLSEKFDLSGYIDARFVQWGAYNSVPSKEFLLQRAGLELIALVTETIGAEVKIEAQPDELFLKDAFISWSPFSLIETRIGQFKRETLLGDNLSSWDLPMLDRPLVSDLYENLTYAGRDLGLDFKLDLPPMGGIELRGIAGVSNGDERGNERTDNELLYSLRGEMEIPSIDLTLGGSAVSHRLGQETSAVPEGYFVSARQNAFSADVSFDYKVSNWYEISACADFAMGDNWRLSDVAAGQTAPTFRGFWGGLTGFYHPWNVRGIKTVSLGVCFDQLTPDIDLDSRNSRLSVIGSIYPSDNIRFRFGGVKCRNTGILFESNYTDYIFEAGLLF